MLHRAGLACLASALLLATGHPLAAQADVEQRRTLEVAGVRRSYLLAVPSASARVGPLPLVLVFHAAGGNGRGIARHTGFSRLAARDGFIAVYPDGVGGRWSDGRLPGGRDDVGFVRALIDTLGGELDIDRRRIYATGISNGAMFTHHLACELPGVLAAIAPVAGALPAAVAERCGTAPPVSVISFQGTADRSMPYAGSATLRGGPVLSATESASFWARAAGCSTPAVQDPPTDSVTDGTRLRRTAWQGCTEGREVVLYAIEGGGHTWPGGPAVAARVGRASREVDATSTIWEFFQRHPRP
jgi:polyhydroxybutyrate depolymerase